MIGILGGMGTQAGLDFCNKLAILYRGKIDQEYPLFLLFNKSNIPGRPESIGVQTKNLSNRKKNKKIEKKYSSVLKSLLYGCGILKKSNALMEEAYECLEKEREREKKKIEIFIYTNPYFFNRYHKYLTGFTAASHSVLASCS